MSTQDQNMASQSQPVSGAVVGSEPSAAQIMAALHEGRRAIGDHWAPNDCYATGPVTGNEYRDLVECPACSFIAMYDAVCAKAVQS